MMKKKLLSILGYVATMAMLLVVSMYGVYHFATETITEVRERKDLGDYPPLSGLDRRIINIMLLGQSALYDDFIHLWTTQYLTKPGILKKDPKELEQILRRIAQLKIRSPYFYQMACFRFIFDFKTPWLCEDIAKIGLEAAPESWMIGAVLGYAYIEQESYVEAAAMFARASHIKDSPEYLKTVGSTLLYKKGVSEKILDTILNDESSKHILKQLREGLERKQGTSKELPHVTVSTVEPAPSDNDDVSQIQSLNSTPASSSVSTVEASSETSSETSSEENQQDQEDTED